MDRRRRQWVPIDAHVAHGRTGERLQEKFGRDGLLVWLLYLAACKRSVVQGTFTYTSETDGWRQLGLQTDVPKFTLEQFFAFTGQMKKTRVTRGRRMADTGQRRGTRMADVRCTAWGDWNKKIQRDANATQKRRKRTQNTADNPRTLDGRYADDMRTLGVLESESEKESEKELLNQFTFGVSEGTNHVAAENADTKPGNDEEQAPLEEARLLPNPEIVLKRIGS